MTECLNWLQANRGSFDRLRLGWALLVGVVHWIWVWVWKFSSRCWEWAVIEVWLRWLCQKWGAILVLNWGQAGHTVQGWGYVWVLRFLGFLGCLRNSQYCVYLIIECLKRYHLLCFSLVYVLLVLVTFLWLLDHGLWRVQGGHALYIYARVRCYCYCYCYCIYMYIYNAYVAYVRRMYACITFHAGVIHKHWCLVSFHLFSFYFYAMMYVVRFLLFIWLIDVCMVCMLFIRLSPSSDLSVFYILLLLWLTTMLLLFWFWFFIFVLFRFYQRHI